MPIYEYRCSILRPRARGAAEALPTPPLTDCPSCHSDTLVKLVSAAGFQLKGSGWYATDFRNGQQARAPKSDARRRKAASAGSEVGRQVADAKAETASGTTGPSGEPRLG